MTEPLNGSDRTLLKISGVGMSPFLIAGAWQLGTIENQGGSMP